jgi:hypothetical protein
MTEAAMWIGHVTMIARDNVDVNDSVADTCPFLCFTPRSPQFPIQVIARATRPRSTKGGSVPKK